jgi:hypothetical protein
MAPPQVRKFELRQQSRWRFVIPVLIVAFAVAQIWLVTFGLRHLTVGDRAATAASIFTADAVLLAAWQWRAQRREVSLEAYFARLDVPNERRLAYYEKVIDAIDKAAERPALARAIEQFYIFYMYAELDNLEYAMTKYVNGGMASDLAERAVRTFTTRCAQSRDFQETAAMAVQGSGYSEAFEELVTEIVQRAGGGIDIEAIRARPHPMRYDELDVVRKLTETKS